MASCSMLEKKEAEEVSTIIGPNWLELPRDVTVNILQRLGTVDIVTSVCQVCPLWWKICKEKNPLMWRTIHMISNRDNTASRYDLVKICRYAIQQSCGHVEDISIENFGTNDLLKYIAQSLSVASLEAIGQCCPLLKVLKFNSKKILKGFECNNDVAFAIAKTMPKLCHLHLLGNKLSNVGLLAILDGCPLLESLDLRKCFYLDLSGSLWKIRCKEEIKNLLSPIDPTENFPFTFKQFCRQIIRRRWGGV
ncbi:Leucine-rich repeat domain superfamily [Sesbania bispinosa]|nr:Leucine-rich repeat domain superfamily [Sesbania bispinosa]